MDHILYPSSTVSCMCINNDKLPVSATSLSNMEHDLKMDIPSFDTPISLSNIMFLEEEDHFLSTPTNLEKVTK